jgi:hypothetical protein
MGKYVNNHLIRDESVAFETKYHWVIFLTLKSLITLTIAPLIQRALSEFVITNRRIIIKEGFIKGNAKQKFNSLLALSMFIVGKMAEQAMRDVIKPGEEEKERSRLADAVLSMPELIPIVGGIIATTYNGAGEPVILKFTKQAFDGVKTTFTGKKTETRQKAALNAVEAILAIFKGYPGLTQSFDILERKLFSDKKSTNQGKIKIRSNESVKPIKVKPAKIKVRASE